MANVSTYWKRVRFNGDDVPWELKDIPNKGVAAFATRSFKAGEWICTEFPVTWIEGHNPFTIDQINDIEQKVSKLSYEDKEAFYAMANVYNVDELVSGCRVTAAAGVFMTNSFDMTDSIYGQACAMYLALGRLNHSCTPNVQQTHIPETTEEVVYAARDIRAGEELNDCYIELRQTRAQRRALLNEFYRFHCDCAGCTGVMSVPTMNSIDIIACTSPSELTTVFQDKLDLNASSSSLQSTSATTIQNISQPITTPSLAEIERTLHEEDRLRTRVMEYTDVVVDLVEFDNTQTALDLAIQTTKQMMIPSAIRWSARYLAEAFLTVYQIALSMGSKALAREYLQKAHNMNIQLTGERSPETKKTEKLLSQMK